MSTLVFASSTAADVVATSSRPLVADVHEVALQPYVDAARYARAVEVSRRMVTDCLRRFAYGFRFAFEKSYSFLIASTARHTGRAQTGLPPSRD